MLILKIQNPLPFIFLHVLLSTWPARDIKIFMYYKTIVLHLKDVIKGIKMGRKLFVIPLKHICNTIMKKHHDIIYTLK